MVHQLIVPTLHYRLFTFDNGFLPGLVVSDLIIGVLAKVSVVQGACNYLSLLNLCGKIFKHSLSLRRKGLPPNKSRVNHYYLMSEDLIQQQSKQIELLEAQVNRINDMSSKLNLDERS